MYVATKPPPSRTINATVRIVNNREQALTSWQVVWRFADTERIEAASVAGGLLFEAGELSGPPSRVVNFNDWDQNGVILAEGGFRDFTFEARVRDGVPSDVADAEFWWARRIKDVSVNGLECRLVDQTPANEAVWFALNTSDGTAQQQNPAPPVQTLFKSAADSTATTPSASAARGH